MLTFLPLATKWCCWWNLRESREITLQSISGPTDGVEFSGSATRTAATVLPPAGEGRILNEIRR